MKLSLRYLILFVALLSIGLTLIASITSGYRVSQESLIENTLETNRVYAKKIAYTTDNFLESTVQTLEQSAKMIAEYLEQDGATPLLFSETERLRAQTNTFNSVAIVSESGRVIAISPESLDVVGAEADSEGGKQALIERKPLISKPYESITGRLIISISHPIFDATGNYFGYVVGTIYLLEENVLNELLGDHFYQDGSYVYVVDGEGRILYHPDQSRINTSVKENPAVQEIMKGNSGTKRLANSEGVDMLAGYADIPITNWGTVSQRETEVALRPASVMKQEMLMKALPFLFFSLLVIILLANRIAHPLQKLGNYAETSMETGSYEKVKGIQAWYYEAIQLEKVLVKSFTFWEDKVNYFIYQSTTDPLTGLFNRRFMDEQTQKWEGSKTSYSVILFDIDRFKRVNDTYGHSTGDEVLKFLADKMRMIASDTDICCRYGGEEFIILMPEKTLAEAFEVAEKLRKDLENTISPTGKEITISGGLANFPLCGDHTVKIIEVADQRLYQAKETGRNKMIR